MGRSRRRRGCCDFRGSSLLAVACLGGVALFLDEWLQMVPRVSELLSPRSPGEPQRQGEAVGAASPPAASRSWPDVVASHDAAPTSAASQAADPAPRLALRSQPASEGGADHALPPASWSSEDVGRAEVTTSVLQEVVGATSAAPPVEEHPAPAIGTAPAGTVAGAGDPSRASTYGFYFPVYFQIPGTLRVLGRVRKHYPDSPIYVLQDGGTVDFGKICTLPRYNCTFQALTGENSRWNPHSWMLRFYEAAKILKTDFMIYLEPDVEVKRRHRIEPKHDAGGIYDNFNPAMKAATVYYVERLGRQHNPCFELQWFHFGLAGGSYFRTAAVLDAFAPAHIARIDWGPIGKKETDKAMSSDFAMHVALSSRGYIVYPWEEAAQHMKSPPKDPEELKEYAKKWPAFNHDTAFEHNHKEHYGDATEPSESKLLGKRLDTTGDVACHGCVWFTGPELKKRLPVPSAAPPPTDPDAVYDATKAQKDRLPPPDPSTCKGGRPISAKPTAEQRQSPSAAPTPVAANSQPAVETPPPPVPATETPLLVRGSAESSAGSADVAAPGSTFGFYFPVYNQIPATLKVIRDVRRFYPSDSSPMYLVSDGGFVDFGPICALPEYACSFEFADPANMRWNPHPWFARMYRAASLLNTTYMIYLEPDVLVTRRHEIEPRDDAGGIYDNFNPTMPALIAAYAENFGRQRNPCFQVRWHHFGLAGGSYFRTAAVLDSFAPERVVNIDFLGFKQEMGNNAFTSDLIMHVALTMRGWTVYPWKECAQNMTKGAPLDEEGRREFAKKWPAFNPDAAFQHNHKEFYKDPVPARETALINSHKRQRPKDTMCQGCVWYGGPNLDSGGEKYTDAPRPVDTRFRYPGGPPPKLRTGCKAFDAW